MAKQIGLGIIGTGFARRVQIPAFLGCEGVFLASVASGSIDNARATAEEFGSSHFTGDWRESVSRADVDLVVITTPPNLHKEMVLAAAEAGKHILCEKPMAMNLAEAEEMAAATKSNGRLALIDHELRFQPGRQRAFSMIREGRIGKIRHVRSTFQARHRGDPAVAWNWWSDISQGGGALGAIGSHQIDSLNWLLGTLPSKIYCQLKTHIKRRNASQGETRNVTTDDELHLLLDYDVSERTADASGLISISMTDGPVYRNELEVYGSDGAIMLDHVGNLFSASSGVGEWERVDVPIAPNVPGIGDTGFARGFMAFAPQIVKAIQNGEQTIEHAATFEDGVRVQRVLDAARESDRLKASVSL